jgi:hypothetical protein
VDNIMKAKKTKVYDGKTLIGWVWKHAGMWVAKSKVDGNTWVDLDSKIEGINIVHDVARDHKPLNFEEKPTRLDHRNGGPKLTKEERQALVKVVLPVVQSEKEMRDQWLTSNLKLAAEHEAKMETLMEVVEAANCGSVGGFDKGQIGDLSVDKRYAWLRDRARKEFNFLVVGK